MRRCACGREHASLLDLPRVGTMSIGGEVLLLVNCPDCGTTLSLTLVPFPQDVIDRLGLEDESPLAEAA